MNEKRNKKRWTATTRLDLDSKFWKTFMIVLAAFLTFAGPTYIIYAFVNILKIDYFISMASGIILFLAGLVIIWYLTKKKIIS